MTFQSKNYLFLHTLTTEMNLDSSVSILRTTILELTKNLFGGPLLQVGQLLFSLLQQIKGMVMELMRH